LNANTTTAPISPHSGLHVAPTKTRWLILFLISLMYLICYMDRSNISVAQPEIAKAFGLSKTAMSLVLSAFTWSYALGQIPAGWLGDRFGPKRVARVWLAVCSAILSRLRRSWCVSSGEPRNAALVSTI